MSNRPLDIESDQPQGQEGALPLRKKVLPGANPGPDRDVSDGGGGGFLLFLLFLLMAFLVYVFI